MVDDVCTRLSQNRAIRQALPGGGELTIDRMLPYLCVYRKDPARNDEGTAQFVTAEASFLYAPGDASTRRGLRNLVRRIVKTASTELGGFLILEIWSSDHRVDQRSVDAETGEMILPSPGFRILTRTPHRPEGTVASLEFALQRVSASHRKADVEIDLHARNHPPGLTQLLSAAEAQSMNCHILGLEIRPIFRDATSNELYLPVLRQLRNGVAPALKKSFYSFALNQTSFAPEHYFSLGRSKLPRHVWNVDRQLAAVSSSFKFLLAVTPINAERSWREFDSSGYSKDPSFEYRPLDSDPVLLKRRLMGIATERIDDPVIAHLMRQTQDELDRQITMLSDIGTRRFLPGSLQVYGGVEPSLLKLAGQILRRTSKSENDSQEKGEIVDAKAFARHSLREFKFYSKQSPGFPAKAIVRDDIYSGLLSTGGNLLIGRETRIQKQRLNALLQHEIGTHLVTYYNGQSQPLNLLKVGLAGYESLQEGLAVLSEYLVHGLSRSRLRTLAARVVAIDALIKGEKFTTVFHLLVDNHGFEPRVAFTIVLRAFRGGGLTKDAVYLQGLVKILRWIGREGDLNLLLCGKVALEHVPIVRELLARGILRQPVWRPRYMEDPKTVERLETIRRGISVLDLLGVGSKNSAGRY